MTDLNQMSTDKPREFCGLFGVFGVPDAAKLIYAGLFSLQHRGQEGAGIVASDGEKIRSTKGMGLINDVFVERPPSTLPGHLGIGHVRYSTTGSSRPQNVQPIVFECLDGIWALAHNGNLTNAARMRRSYQEAGAIFQTSTDSEILMHLLADPMYRSRTRRVERALGELDGAFSFLLMTKDSVMATRDRYGFRPLSIGRLGSGYVFASETCALDQVGATFERDVMPGELVIVDAKGIRSSTFCEPITGQLGQCIFEHVYFARPDSMIFGQNVHETRLRLGRRLAKEHPVEADVVIPIPDSGNAAALGFSQESGIPMDYGFIRNHYVGRTFIMPEMEQRADSADLKLAVVPGQTDRRHRRLDHPRHNLAPPRGSLEESGRQGNPRAHFLPAYPAPLLLRNRFPFEEGTDRRPARSQRSAGFHRRGQPCLPEPRGATVRIRPPGRLLRRLLHREVPGGNGRDPHEEGAGKGRRRGSLIRAARSRRNEQKTIYLHAS